MRAALSVVVAIFAFSAAAVSAQNCPLPPVLQPLQPGTDIFTDKQEADLGDAMAEQAAPRLKIIENDALADYLRALGNRLVQHLPPTNLNFRFYLIDRPEPNAFSIAGGRVYVARKLIAMTKNEDELAGILAHEYGSHSDSSNGNLYDPAFSGSAGRDSGGRSRGCV
jgi:predicted Zn-dependent protease